MKVKADFVLREIAGDYMVIPVGDNYVDFAAVMVLNETGAFLWNCLTNDIDEEDLCKRLQKEYDVSADEARSDIADFIKQLNENGLIMYE